MGKSKRFPAEEEKEQGMTAAPASKGRAFAKGPNAPNSSTKTISQQVRSLDRLIRNKGSSLPPAVLKKKQAELDELRLLASAHSGRNKQRAISKKYRMVRFFERRKLERILSKIESRGNRPEDKEEKKQAQRDLQYVNHFPNDEKYVSLFPKGGHSTESQAKVDEVRARIESPTAAGDLLPSADVQPDKVDGSTEEQKDDFFLDDNGESAGSS